MELLHNGTDALTCLCPAAAAQEAGKTLRQQHPFVGDDDGVDGGGSGSAFVFAVSALLIKFFLIDEEGVELLSALWRLLWPTKYDEDVPPSRLCAVCLQREKRAALLPCGHANVCLQCPKKFSDGRCPTCRKRIRNIVRLYDQ